MNRMLFLFGCAGIFFSCLFTSCQKAGVNLNSGLPPLDSGRNATTPPAGGSTSSSDYYLTADMDGVHKTFNVSAMAIETKLSGFTVLEIQGSVTSLTNLEGLGITINNSGASGKAITAGDYSELETDGMIVGAVYNPGSTTIVWGTGVAQTDNPLKVTISQIDAKTVKGTFSGDFFYINTTTTQIGPDKKVFSNGKFYLKF